MNIADKLAEFFAKRANEQEVLNQFGQLLKPEEIEPYLKACTEFAKMGWKAEQINELVNHIVESRIVAYGFGTARVIGTTDRKEFPWL